MKKGFNILLILCAALVAISCSKTKSYTDMLKDEKKAIERFIDDKGLEILDDFLLIAYLRKISLCSWELMVSI